MIQVSWPPPPLPLPAGLAPNFSALCARTAACARVVSCNSSQNGTSANLGGNGAASMHLSEFPLPEDPSERSRGLGCFIGKLKGILLGTTRGVPPRSPKAIAPWKSQRSSLRVSRGTCGELDLRCRRFCVRVFGQVVSPKT